MAVCRAVMATTALRPGMRWPNDVIIGGKKVAGILTEISSELDRVSHVVLGIGVNINTPGAQLAGIVGGVGTSLSEKNEKPISRVFFVQHLLNEFEALYLNYLASGFGPLRAELKELDITVGSRVKVGNGADVISGKAIDIDEDGFLIVSQKKGDIKRIVSGDVSLVSSGD
jgi:BirA family biotin operon repressor/biotin-[acetyl-CoA-carboxylase] ligase